jgi:hypothetical protein
MDKMQFSPRSPENPAPMAMLGAVGNVSMMGLESGVMVYMQDSSILTSGTTPGNRSL